MIQFDSTDIQKQLIQPSSSLNLKATMILLIGSLILAVVLVMGVFLNYFMTDTLEAQLGEQALSVAESIALNPAIALAFSEDDPAAIIQPLVSPIQQSIDAEFIVVGNMDEIRYSHPNPGQIGQKMVGEDNARALFFGETYLSKATGSLGNSLRAKVPIYSDDKIIGVVSVGFLADDIQTLIGNYNKELWLMLLSIGLVAALAAIGIASYLKHKLHGLEPEEISRLLLQKETILQSTHEGIIAVNSKGQITLLNHMAQQLLFGGDASADKLIGEPIGRVLPTSDLPEILATQKSHYDKEHRYGGHAVYVNSGPIFYENTLIGAVSTFRNKTEIDQLTKELSQVKQYANALRAQTHEFSNKLYTISGLVHLNKKQEVLEFIRMENDIQQEWIQQLIGKVSDPLISGILLGKLNQASEQQANLAISPDSRLKTPLTDPQKEALLAAIGNLIDNALDAVKENPAGNRRISLYFTDVGTDILLEIDDSGPGIPMESEGRLFNEGFSSKTGKDRGYGLSTTRRLAMLAGGELHMEESDLGGACFVVSLPKRRSEDERELARFNHRR
ncbi:sensor histidine kinase [Planomicrobium sp. CPCC 101110]|uniref:ATP-binding protein n=1 Tax=Planomicrobium sp. CPCC 101110 TaxID=2599619 RepID=UPI0011B3D5E9|nr:sensor histidine kinase [Planomicrobium sp. CPCC 101110]TWT25247.1 sensor histidine kinase [Planomicrobium sp. CPCC 101110]